MGVACLVFGGRSAEHEVSIRSAQFVADGIRSVEPQLLLIKITKDGRWFLTDSIDLAEPEAQNRLVLVPGDGIYLKSTWEKLDISLCYLIIHGTACEDGEIQGLLGSCFVPYTGSGLLSSADSFSKTRTKELVSRRFAVLRSRSFSVCPEPEELEGLSFPLIVKPDAAGSSVGISVLHQNAAEDIRQAFERAYGYSDLVIFENAVTDCREFECAVVRTGSGLRAMRICELMRSDMFLSYDYKYLSGIDYVRCPADVSNQFEGLIQQTALEIFTLLGCSGYGRVDFLYDNKAGILYFNEMTTLPGMTAASHFPKMLRASGISWQDFWTWARESALMRAHKQVIEVG